MFEAPVGLCFLDRELRYVFINEWLAELNGTSVEGHLGRTVGEVLPEVAAGAELQLRSVLKTGVPVINGTVEAETPAEPGQKRIFQHNYYPVLGDDGTVVGVSCAVQDITERERAEQALRKTHEELEQRLEQRTAKFEHADRRLRSEVADRRSAKEEAQRHLAALAHATRFSSLGELAVSSRMLAAVEDERRAIARELHDDVAQHLASLSLDVALLEPKVTASSPTNGAELRQLISRITGVATGLSDLSRRIHPLILEELGLMKAIASESEKFSRRTGISVDYVTDNAPEKLPMDIALVLYRVLQEALRNVEKHARALSTCITLTQENGHVILSVQDTGRGFIFKRGHQPVGLGLASMRERAALLKGELHVQTAAGRGTRLTVRLPIVENER